MPMAKILNIRFCSLCLVFLLGWNWGLLAQNSSLEKKYSFTFQNISVESVIDSLRKVVDYGISYNPEILPKHKTVSGSFQNQPLNVILDSIFYPLKLSYKLVNNNIVIVKAFIIATHANIIKPQDSLKFIQLSGRICSKKDKEPVPYVNVYLKNKNIGTLSNNDGNFVFKVPLENVDDSVFFSSIGFITSVKKVSDLQSPNNLILLEDYYIKINEVTVKYIDAKTILKKVIERIPHNYSSIPLMLTGFYRETIMQNRDYVSLSEAILRIYKSPYHNYAGDRVNIYKGRKSPFVKQMDTLSFKFQGGITTCLLLDIAKNPSNFLSDEFMEYYDYKLEDMTNIEGHTTYIISFDQKDYVQYALYAGKIYIDRESLAIVRADFKLSPKGIDYAADLLVQKSPRGIKVKPVTSNYIVNYSVRNNNWYLNYIREDVKFKVHKRLSLYSILFGLSAEMVITATDSINVQRFKNSEVVHFRDIFIEKIGRYDPGYWEGFNFIPPEESLEEALMKIKTKTAK